MNENFEELKDASKINITLADGTSQAEVVLRYGEAPKQLEPKEPLKIQIDGVLSSPREFLAKRKDTGQFDINRCRLIVDRSQVKIMLIINEHDYYNIGEIIGNLSFHPKFLEFGINSGKRWSPAELGMFLKMNRTFFKDKTENMKLVTELMNFTATVNNKIERAVKENGSNTDNFAQVVNSNLPTSFKIYMPIFKGGIYEDIEIETFAHVDGRDVSFVLLSPGANQTLETTRDSAIDKELEAIKKISPNLVIIEV